jgi:hypothetical protein
MAKASTVNAVKSDLEGNGKTIVPFKTIEYLLGQSHEDDDDFESAISGYVNSKDWLSSYHIDWINMEVSFTGPWTELGDDI